MQKFLPKIKNGKPAAFTIMEILVATTIFAFISVALTSLFNYTLRINRQAEALRQASQDTLNFVELIAKEVRNGQVDYGVLNGQTVESQNSPCPLPPSSDSGALSSGQNLSGLQNIASSYGVPDNRLGITDINGDRWCFYLGDSKGNYVAKGTFSGQTAVLVKDQGTPQVINPPNESISYLAFFIQPICDPYVITCKDYGNAAPKVQPVVTILADFSVKLPTGETVSIPYQTTVSTDRYDVPNSP